MNFNILEQSKFSLEQFTFQVKTSLFIILFSLIVLPGFSQTKNPKIDELTDEQIVQFYEKAQESGMTESQIEKAALSRGYTPSDIAKMKDRIAKVKANQKNTSDDKDNTNSTGRTLPNDLSKKKTDTPAKNKNDEQDDQDNEQNPDKSLNISKLKSNKDKKDSLLTEKPEMPKKVKIFGSNLFNNETLTFEPNLRIATPKSYQLGPDDELNVDIFGDVLDNYKLKVSPEGTVKVLNLSPIYVNGLTVDAASERIIGRLRQLYQGLNHPGSGASAQVTLGNVRSIKVTLTGEVKYPGTYTLSSLATVFNALYFSGGPSENGSFRNIKVIRDNKVVRVLDLYDFLLRADQKDNIRLQDQDIIRVSDYETRVEFEGEVKRPMIFEVQKGENLKDVLRFAGGFTDKAYTYTIGLKRNTSRELKLINITQDEVNTFIPQNGDKYAIGAIIERYENKVEIKGSVFRPGEYAIENGLSTVKELIRKAEGVKEDAFLNRAIITRRKENYDPEIIAFDLGKLLRGEVKDIPLIREDVITITAIGRLREIRTVTISGEVNREGTFDYIDGMTVGDLIIKSGGFTYGASVSKLQLSRRVKDDTTGLEPNQSVIIKTFDINENLQLTSEESKYVLKPFDLVYVRKSPRYEPQKNVEISGEVLFPGKYSIKDKSQRISDLIKMAGGLKEGAFLRGARFYRDTTIIGVELQKVLEKPDSKENLLLLDLDRLVIPRELQTVKLTGELLNPVSIPFNRIFTIKDYISAAGGYTEFAVRNRVYVKYANGTSGRTKHIFFIPIYPKVEQGSEIVIPSKAKNARKLTPSERIAIVAGIASLSLTITSIVNLINK